MKADRLKRFDLIVVGGGPSGCAAAITAARLGMQVALIEKSDYSYQRLGEHVAPEAATLLRDLGVDLESCRFAIPCHGVTSDWGNNQPRETNYFFNAYGSGYNTDRAALDQALFEKSRASGVTCFASATAELNRLGQGVRCRINGTQTRQECMGRYVVDATGRTAAVAKMLGSSVTTTDNLIAIHFIVEALVAETHLFHVEALPDGWLYYGCLPDTMAVVAIMTDADILKTSTLTPDEFWLHSVRKSSLLGALPPPKSNPSVVVRSARSQVLSTPCGECFTAAGDALMTFDPLSSDGIRKGIQSGIEASRMLYGVWSESERRAFTARCHERYSAYLRERSAYYKLEQRWPQSLFWNRRQSMLATKVSRISRTGITAG